MSDNYRVALLVKDGTPVDSVVLEDGLPGDEYLLSNPELVEVTGLSPMPGVGNGWVYDGYSWSNPYISLAEKDQIMLMRQIDYINEADPLFFKWQAEEATKEEWLAKREEIKNRHPYS